MLAASVFGVDADELGVREGLAAVWYHLVAGGGDGVVYGGDAGGEGVGVVLLGVEGLCVVGVPVCGEVEEEVGLGVGDAEEEFEAECAGCYGEGGGDGVGGFDHA